jgi:hypothetical protein
LVWALAGALLAFCLAPQGRKAVYAWCVGLAVASHWFVDLLVHRPDLGLLWETPKLGFGLWNHPPLAMGLELGVLALGFWFFLRGRNWLDKNALGPLLVLVGCLLLGQGVNWFTPAPEGLLATAIPPLLIYSVFAGLAYWLERSIPAPNSVTRPSSIST